MKKTITKKKLIKTILLLSMLGTVSVSSANGFFGNNNGFGNFFGGNNNNGCTDWPIWTPMYWMEEMSGNSFGNNKNCNSGNNGYNGNNYPAPYQSAYQNPYSNPYPNPYQTPYQPSYSTPYRANYAQNPYLVAPQQQFTNPYPVRPQTYVYRPAPMVNNYNALPQGNFNRSGFSPFRGTGMSGFPSFGGGKSFSNNPMSSFSSSMGNGGFPPLSGMTSPMSGMSSFGSPMSPMGMGGMTGMNPMTSMSPMSSFGGSPFGGGFSPFR